MSSEKIRSLVSVAPESGPLYEHLLATASNKRPDRLRHLAYLGLIVERGLLNVGATLPAGASMMHKTVPSGTATASSATQASENGTGSQKQAVVFPQDDLEHIGM